MAQQPYQPLSASEEDGEKDVRSAGYKHPHDRTHDHPHRFLWTTLLTYLPWLLTLIFALSTLGLLARKADLQIAGDVAKISPYFRHQITTFQPNQSFVANLTTPSFKNSTHHLWLDIVPKGLGFLHIPNPENNAQLPPPYHRHNKTVYTTSMTHQLHCLYMIMGSYNDIAVNGYTAPPDGEQDPHWHIAHCFDYIRQAIMCAGDVALEGEETTFPEGKTGTDGWNVKHVCKAYGDVYNWLEEMAVDNRTRI
ncbi:hypothetical protein B0A50_01005 [Salinomyces thailandicus]|uniref:Oxidase ustYa n=1 Tax=Salinomyces thailandicus TaxID=706561 RepID=A0A4U0UBH0_9PEZI|nr:hypothetical protein B0A50_01005 [Salinomyces thailandica]